MGYAQEYAPAIMRRGRVAMEPADFKTNWADAPRKTKYYPGLGSIPLPHGSVPAEATLQAGLDRRDGPGSFNLSLLSGMLLDTYAMLGRRLGVQANSDLAALPLYPTANWFRGTTSGGGLYPCAIYWVCGPSGPMPPGIYYYSTPRHAMQPLLRGDVSGEVRAALGDLPGAGETDQYLVIGIKFWQNAFKYNSFAYHAVTMDLGALLEGWRTWAGAQDLRIEPALWFDEARLAHLLGVSEEEEGVFAVVPLAWEGTPGASGIPGTPSSRDAAKPAAGAAAARRPRVAHSDLERSRQILDFPILRRIREATIGYAAQRPAPDALDAAAIQVGAVADSSVPPLSLPRPVPLDTNVRVTARRRRSSFGRFEARPMTAAQLAALLASSAAVRLDCDAVSARTPALTKLYAFVNHVDDVPPGAYEYDPATNSLLLVKPGPSGEFLDRNYFLANYCVEQAAAVLVPAMRTGAILQSLGDRAYNLVNATIGAISQNCYMTAASLGLGCGVALGFDCVSYVEELDLEPTGESPLLMMMVGNERRHQANYRYEIV